MLYTLSMNAEEAKRIALDSEGYRAYRNNTISQIHTEIEQVSKAGLFSREIRLPGISGYSDSESWRRSTQIIVILRDEGFSVERTGSDTILVRWD